MKNYKIFLNVLCDGADVYVENNAAKKNTICQDQFERYKVTLQ